MKISAPHILHVLSRGLKMLTVSLLLTVPSIEAQAQSDTCFVSLDITKKDAFALINGSKGEIKIENGQQVLVTPCQILKVVNSSTGIAIDKNNGRFRVISFDSGAATTFDYTREGSTDGQLAFKAVKRSNMRGYIYFLLPNRESKISFRLENDEKTEHVLMSRPQSLAEAPVVNATDSQQAPADRRPVDANELQNTTTPRAEAAQPSSSSSLSSSSTSSSWWPWIITLLAVAGAAGYAYYLRRKEEKALWNDPLGGGDENMVPLEQRTMVKQIRDLQQRLQASLSSDRDHTLRLEHSEKDRKEAISRANKAEEDFKERATKAEEDFKARAAQAEKDFSKRAEQAEKTAEDRAYGAEQQARSRIAAAQQQSEQEIAAAQQKAEQEIAAAQQKSEQEIAAARQEAENGIAAARQLASEQIAQAQEDKIKGIEEAREEAYLRATQEYNVHVEAIQTEATNRINAAETNATERITAAETEATTRINAAETNATERINAAEAQAKEITETAEQVAHDAIANKQAAIDEACQPLFEQISQLEKEKSTLEEATKQTLTNMDAELKQAIAEKEAAIAQAAAEKDAAIAQAAAEKDAAIAQATAEKDAAIAQATEDKDSTIAQTLEAAKAAIAQAQQEKESAVSQALNDKEMVVSNALAEKESAIAQALADKEAAVAKALAEKEEGIALYRNNFREEHLNERNQYVAHIKTLLERVGEQMVLMKEGIETLGTDNNYSNTTMHMARKEADFSSWFEKNILEAGEDGPETVADVRQMLQEQILVLLSGNYSWLTELIRFKAYAGISADFQREFRRSGIPVEAVRSAHTAMEAILGMLNISIIVPQLFAEEFNGEIHRNCNAPIVNSFYPKGFDERRQQLRGIICDVLRVGVELNGQQVQMPEVSTF